MQDIRVHNSADRRIKVSVADFASEPLHCAFSTVHVVKVGTGTTARKQKTRHLWYVEEHDDGSYGVRKINPQFVPVGDEEVVDRETLLADYFPEVELYNSRIKPAMVSLDKTLDVADGHRERNEPLSAEMEYSKALDVDETNVRATFGLGLVYLGRNDREKARLIFDELVEMNGAFELKHKHLFNEFGISLRKSGLFSEAVQYYTRALDLNKDESEDENLCYNVARAYYEMGQWTDCVEYAARTLAENADHEYALALCRLAVALGANPSLLEKYGKPAVPPQAAERAADLLGSRAGGRDVVVPGEDDLDGDLSLSLE